MKTSELKYLALEWAVAKCEGLLAYGYEDDMGFLRITLSTGETEYFIPTMKWEQGGPIIEREMIDLQPVMRLHTKDVYWRACGAFMSPTPLIAAMRCYVASKLGDDIEVPKELT